MRVERIGACTLYLGDMLEILPTIGKFDACVTDPPYGIGESNEKNLSRGKQSDKWGKGKAKAKATDYGAFSWDANPASPDAIAAMRACSKTQIIFGGNYFDLPPTSCWLVWDKQNGATDFADCELAWTNLPKAVRRIYWRWNGMIRQGNEQRFHPTQKPVGVMTWCIEHLPAPTSIVDPFCGSGSTLVAAARLGIGCVGIERDERYFEIAMRRVEEAYKQPDLFIAPPPVFKQETFL